MSWMLESAQERHQENPYTFYVPSKTVLNTLQPGEHVKLLFGTSVPREDGFTGERMWVEISERNGETFTGILDNEPRYLTELKPGDVITFQSEHICQVLKDDPEGGVMDFYLDTRVMVSHDVFEQEEVNFIIHDHPEDGFSGWIFFSGYEEDGYLDDPENMRITCLGAVLNIDDSFLDFVHDAPRQAYETNDEGDWQIDDAFDWEYYDNE